MPVIWHSEADVQSQVSALELQILSRRADSKNDNYWMQLLNYNSFHSNSFCNIALFHYIYLRRLPERTGGITRKSVYIWQSIYRNTTNSTYYNIYKAQAPGIHSKHVYPSWCAIFWSVSLNLVLSYIIQKVVHRYISYMQFWNITQRS